MLSRTNSIYFFLAAAMAALFLLFICTPGAAAQCALCRTALEKGGEQTARAINTGILVLLVPPVAIFCSVFVAVIKSKKADDES
ncbi:MAG: hypothetical protein LC754_04695 [Acidobacteria bacterium]|nr:hypothetical protein [Acidobacteriota bacterium]